MTSRPELSAKRWRLPPRPSRRPWRRDGRLGAKPRSSLPRATGTSAARKPIDAICCHLRNSPPGRRRSIKAASPVCAARVSRAIASRCWARGRPGARRAAHAGAGPEVRAYEQPPITGAGPATRRLQRRAYDATLATPGHAGHPHAREGGRRPSPRPQSAGSAGCCGRDVRRGSAPAPRRPSAHLIVDGAYLAGEAMQYGRESGPSVFDIAKQTAFFASLCQGRHHQLPPGHRQDDAAGS